MALLFVCLFTCQLPPGDHRLRNPGHPAGEEDVFALDGLLVDGLGDPLRGDCKERGMSEMESFLDTCLHAIYTVLHTHGLIR